MTIAIDDSLATYAGLLEADLRREFSELREHYAGQHFYVIGLYTTPLYEYFAPVGNSEEALAEERWRWVPGEWTCRLENLDGMKTSNDALADLMAKVPEEVELEFIAGDLKDTVFGVIKKLRRDHVFDIFGDPRRLLLNVVTPDDDDESWISDAAALNPPAVWQPMAIHLRRSDGEYG